MTVMNDFLQCFFVLDHENYGHVFQFPPLRRLKPRRFRKATQSGTKCSKVNIRWVIPEEFRRRETVAEAFSTRQMKTAKTFGITVPSSRLARAEEVIE
jgi:hypothetical protein